MEFSCAYSDAANRVRNDQLAGCSRRKGGCGAFEALSGACSAVCVCWGGARSLLKILTVTLYSFSNNRALLLPDFLLMVLMMPSALELMAAFY